MVLGWPADGSADFKFLPSSLQLIANAPQLIDNYQTAAVVQDLKVTRW